MEIHRKRFWLIAGFFFFLQNKIKWNGHQDNFWKTLMKMAKFRSWKALKSHGKGHGKSWNFKKPKRVRTRDVHFVIKLTTLPWLRLSLFYFCRNLVWSANRPPSCRVSVTREELSCCTLVCPLQRCSRYRCWKTVKLYLLTCRFLVWLNSIGLLLGTGFLRLVENLENHGII